MWANMANRTVHVSSAPSPTPTQAAYGTTNTNKPYGTLLMNDTYLRTPFSAKAELLVLHGVVDDLNSVCDANG